MSFVPGYVSVEYTKKNDGVLTLRIFQEGHVTRFRTRNVTQCPLKLHCTSSNQDFKNSKSVYIAAELLAHSRPQSCNSFGGAGQKDRSSGDENVVGIAYKGMRNALILVREPRTPASMCDEFHFESRVAFPGSPLLFYFIIIFLYN